MSDELDDLKSANALLHGLISNREAEIERLRALLVRYQAANYAPEDSDLYEETRRALERK